MVDIDHFKTINDEHGHPAGDVVLREVAQLLQDTLRTVDSLGRYGGEEFVAILPHTACEEARQTGGAPALPGRSSAASAPGRASPPQRQRGRRHLPAPGVDSPEPWCAKPTRRSIARKRRAWIRERRISALLAAPRQAGHATTRWAFGLNPSHRAAAQRRLLCVGC